MSEYRIISTTYRMSKLPWRPSRRALIIASSDAMYFWLKSSIPLDGRSSKILQRLTEHVVSLGVMKIVSEEEESLPDFFPYPLPSVSYLHFAIQLPEVLRDSLNGKYDDWKGLCFVIPRTEVNYIVQDYWSTYDLHCDCGVFHLTFLAHGRDHILSFLDEAGWNSKVVGGYRPTSLLVKCLPAIAAGGGFLLGGLWGIAVGAPWSGRAPVLLHAAIGLACGMVAACVFWYGRKYIQSWGP